MKSCRASSAIPTTTGPRRTPTRYRPDHRWRWRVADSGVYPDALPEHAHFDSIERRRAAGRLAMWAFLASEVLFFGGLFTLYFAYRARYPHGFASGIQHNTLA